MLTFAEAAIWDKASIDAGIQSRLLMGWAAASIFQRIRKKLRQQTGVIYILFGPGNNGGDGYALAWLMVSNGWENRIKLFSFAPPKTDDARYFYELLSQHAKGVRILSINDFPDFQIQKEDVVIDALFGNGQTREPDKALGTILTHANKSKGYRISIDVPTGILETATTSTAFSAHHTLTFGGYKTVHLTPPGIYYCGKVTVLTTGFLPEVSHTGITSSYERLEKMRKPNSHKYATGSIWVAGGDSGMEGAAVLSVKAFLSCGGGYARVFSRDGRLHKQLKSLPEVRFSDFGELLSELENSDFSQNKPGVLVYGPGLKPGSNETLENLWNNLEIPMIVDGGGLRELAQLYNRGGLSNRDSSALRILTPHSGEADSLLSGKELATVSEKAKYLAEKYQAVVYYKGPGGVLAFPEGEMIFYGSREYELAVAGTGDVFTGVLASGLCRPGITNINLDQAIATYLTAARKISKRLGSKDALIPSLLIDEIARGK